MSIHNVFSNVGAKGKNWSSTKKPTIIRSKTKKEIVFITRKGIKLNRYHIRAMSKLVLKALK